jgi:hypothetical protein
MGQTLSQSFRAVAALACRGVFSLAGVMALVVCGLTLLLTAKSVTKSIASAVLRIDFVGTNSLPTTPEDYATNSFRWGPLRAEGFLARSEAVVEEALHRLAMRPGLLKSAPSKSADSRQTLTWAMDRLERGYVPHGFRLSAIGESGEQMTALVNEVTKVYQETRSELAPMPPGCQAISITITQPARLNRVALDWARMLRFFLAAGLLGLAAGLLVHRSASGASPRWLPRVIFWSALSLGLAALCTTLTIGPAAAGATLLALFVGCADACCSLVTARAPPVSEKLLRQTFSIIWLLFCLATLLMAASNPGPVCSKARVKVSVLAEETGSELSLSYAPRFLASECELLRSSQVAGRVLDEPAREAMNHQYNHTFTTREAEELLAHLLKPTPVSNSGVIDVWCWNDGPDANTAARVAEMYRDYWDERTKTNRKPRVKVTVLDTATLPNSRERLTQVSLARLGYGNMIATLFLLTGILGVVWLARRPRLLVVIPALALAYVLLFGFASGVSALAPEKYSAASLVRVWPAAASCATGTGDRGPEAVQLMKVESEAAESEAVLNRAVEILDADQDFTSRHGQEWIDRNRYSKNSWVRERVRIRPMSDTFFLSFKSLAENGRDAAAVANAAATAYCRAPAAASTEASTGPVGREVSRPAAPPTGSEPAASSFEKGLGAITNSLVMFFLGAALGFFLVLAERARIEKRAQAEEAATS